MIKQTPLKRVLFTRVQTALIVGLFGVLLIAMLGGIVTSVIPSKFGGTQKVEAATNSTMNFQARLLTSTGAVVPDGNYHIEFKIYNATGTTGSSQGSCTGDAACLWTETRTTGNLVRVVNGYFSVSLGSVTAFGSTIKWDQDLYITMNIGGSGGTASWDGEMTNAGTRMKLTGVPYAFRAGILAKLTGSNTSTLDFATQSAANSILLPDEGGTLCIRNSANCGFATGSGTAFLQGGNTLGALGQIGNNSAFGLQILTGATGRAFFDNSNVLYLGNANVAGGTNAAPSAFTVQGTGSSTATTAGGAVTLQGGTGNTSGAGGLLTLQGGTPGTTGTGGGVTIVSGAGGSTSGASGAVSLASGNSTSGATGTLTIATGNATSGTAGSVSLDVGTSSTGTPVIGIGTGNYNHTINIGSGGGSNTIQIGSATGTSSLSLQSGSGTINLGTFNVDRAINIGTASAVQTVSIGSTTTTSSLLLQAGTGTLNIQTQGTGGINIGTNSVSQNILIGNATGGTIRVGQNGGTLQLDGTNFDLSTAGVLTLAGGQAADITTAAGTTATALVIQPGSSSVNSGTGAALTIQAGSESGTTSVGGNLTLKSGSGTTAGGGVTIDSGTNGSGTISIGTTNALTVSIGNNASSSLVSCGTGSCSFGANAIAHTTTLGSIAGAATTNLQGGTGGINVGNNGLANTIQIGNTTGAVWQTINIGTNATAASRSTVWLGSTIGASDTVIQGGSGNIAISTAGNTGNINITPGSGSVNISGSAAGVNIGNNAVTIPVVIGSTTGGTTTLQSAGGVVISTLGTTNTATYLCRNSSNIVAACNTTGTGAAFIQGGNSFGAIGSIGTNDAFGLQIETNATGRAFFDNSNVLYLGNANVAGGTNAAPSAFTVQGTGSSTATTAGGAVTLQGGTGNTSGAGGLLTLQGGTPGTTGTGGGVTVSGGAGGATSGAGGGLTLSAGSATTSGAGGAVSINGGTGLSGNGGSISITAGTASGGVTGGGSVTITSGGGLSPGAITLQTAVYSGTYGAVNINNSGGTVNLGTGSAAQAFNIGTGAAAKTITVGSSNSGSTYSLISGATTLSGGNGGVVVQTNTNSTTAFKVQNNGASSIFNVDTTNGYVGIGSNSSTPVSALDVSVNSASVTQPAATFQQLGAGDTTLTVKNSSSSYFVGINATDNSFNINSSTAAAGTATIAHVQSASATNDTAGTSIAQAFGSNVTAGNTIIASISWDNTTASTVTCSDSQGNTYSTVTTVVGNNNQDYKVCYAVAGSTGANTVTATISNSRPFRRIFISEYSGVSASSPLDGFSSNVAATGTTATDGVTSGSFSTSQNGDLIYGFVLDDTAGAVTITAGTGFTQRSSLADSAIQSKIQTISGSVASTQTFSSAGGYTAIGVGFKAAATAITDNYANSVLKLNSNGAVTLKNLSNSTTGFQIQNASGSALLTADTSTMALNLFSSSATAYANLSVNTSGNLNLATSSGFASLTSSGTGVTDNFTGSSLDAAWTFTDPVVNSSYSLTSNAGHLQISIPSGTTHDCWTSPTTSCTRMMRPTNNSDAVFETKIDGNNPSATNYNGEGLLVWQDASNYVRCEFGYGTGLLQAFCNTVVGNTGNNPVSSGVITMGTSNGLRLTRTGNSWAFAYSIDGGVSWTTVGSFTAAINVSSAGVDVDNATGNPALIANFDYFKITYPSVARFGIGTTSPAEALDVSGNARIKSSTNTTSAFYVQDSSSNYVLNADTTNGRVGIGTATPSYKLDVQNGTSNFSAGTATNVGVIIQGASSQTADLLQIKDSTGANVLRVDASNDQETIGMYNNGYGGIGQWQNLLTYSEQFDNAAWTKTSVTAPTANTVVAPDNQTSAESLADSASGGSVQQTYTTATNGNYTFSVWLKAASGTQAVDLRIDSTGATPATGTKTTVTATTTWQRFSVTQNFTGTPSNIKVNIFPGGTGGSGTIHAWGAQLNAGTNVLAYARATASTIATNSGVISNGGMFISSINATDKPLVVQGAPSQSGDLFQVQNSAGTVLSSFGSAGYLGVGTAASSTVALSVVGAINTTSGVGGTPSLSVDNAATSTINFLELKVAGTRRATFGTDASGDAVISGTGTGATYLGWNGGSGGVVFGNGAGGSVGSVTSAGVATFSKVYAGGVNTATMDGTNGNIFASGIFTVGTINGSATIKHTGTGGNLHLDSSTSTYIDWFSGNGLNVGNGAQAFGAVAASAFNVSSSRRFKTNIRDTHYTLNDLLQLQPVEYNYKVGSRNDPTKNQVGLIAEDVLNIYPEAVAFDAQGLPNGLDYAKFTPLIVQGVKDLNKIVVGQQEQVTANTTADVALQNGISGVNTRLDSVESQLTSTRSIYNNDFSNLNVAGASTLASLTVNGDASIGGNLTVKGDTTVANLFVGGKIVARGAKPTTAVGAALIPADNANAKVEVSGNDTAGTVTVTTNEAQVLGANNQMHEVPFTTGIIAEVTFSSPYAQMPRVIMTPVNEDSVSAPFYIEKTQTGFKVIFSQTPGANKTYSFDYFVIGSEN